MTATYQQGTTTLGAASVRTAAGLRWSVAIVLVSLIAYALFIPQIVRFLSPLTGDEPFYVMTALSLAHDRDLDETNNYAQRDYASFYPPDPLPADWQGWPAFPRDLPPHAAHSVRPGLYSKHGLGVALLILLPYILGGRIAVLLLLNAVAALVVLNMVLLARQQRLRWLAAVALIVPLAFANPLMSYAYLIFPEIFAALAIVYAFRRGREAQQTLWQWLGIGLSLATLPWLHARFLPAVLGLAVVLWPSFWRERSWRSRCAVLLPILVSALSLLGYYLALYGRPFPAAEDHAGFNTPPEIVNAFFGLFLDEQWGLLIHTPIYLLAIAGLAALWHGRRIDLWPLLVVVAPYLALIAFYRVWWGEWGPPARYLAPIAPLAIVPLARWVTSVRRPVAIATVSILALPGFAIMAGFLANPQLMYNQPDGHNSLFRFWATERGAEWPKILPTFQFYALSSPGERLAWAGDLVLLAIILWLVTERLIAGRTAEESLA